MPYSIDGKLVIALASSALFDLGESDRVYREQGVEAYRAYQRQHEDELLAPGVAFPFVKRLLALNGTDEADKPVEVILLSRNDPDTGSRVFRSIQRHGVDISRAAFVNGGDPLRYLDAFNAALFLSANQEDVMNAMIRGSAAGQVFPTEYVDDSAESELRIAFDFDGVVADDSAETVFRAHGLAAFFESEQQNAGLPLPEGPLHRFFVEVSKLQRRELGRKRNDESYRPRVRIAMVTARSAPAHERVVTTLRKWDIEVDEVFFLGGIDKARVLREFKPHIFFDDQVSHVEGVAGIAPSAHVPFGVANEAAVEILRRANAASSD